MYTTVDAPNTILQYKGKLAHRSWPQLPQEIVRLIATHYLYDLAVNTYCPQTWETRRLWPSRMVYTCIRDSLELEKHIMSICPEWHRAVAKHPFWKQAVSLLDGNDYLLHHMVIHPKPSLNASSMALPPPIYLSHYQHFRNIVGASCHVCRINYPGTNLGLTAAKKFLLNSMLGTVHLCREHDRRRTHFCGLCLRDSFPPGHQDPVREYEMAQAFGILENEDEDTWAGVEATCKKCRMEWLWRRASHSPRDQEAIGGPNFQSSDWETRQCLEGFIDLAEGNIAEVLTLAREKLWLKRYTKYESLGLHALAAQKSHGDDRGQEELEEEYVEEDSEEDKELMLMKDANQVRELALHDWARQRILDGHWMSPADIWYHHQVPGQPSSVQAVHPCPWAREGSEVGTTAVVGTRTRSIRRLSTHIQLLWRAKYRLHTSSVSRRTLRI
ncbi:unnamed protein product [Cyclocybe aegerita]|uniref:Uncharacterized protein n=1 Tax=Cyclocybe aegerita TaxID=1973307 RepID=A0A8S0VQL1_CYCAE|nr:unnamed protein product [Cyclocybe aegerita]